MLSMIAVNAETASGTNSADFHSAAHLSRIVGVAIKKLEVEEWCNPVGLQTVSQKRLYDHCVTQVFATLVNYFAGVDVSGYDASPTAFRT